MILIPLGGFVWWPVAASPSERQAELVAAIWRWIGAAGVAAMFVSPLFVEDKRGVVTLGALAAGGSAFAALLVRRPPEAGRPWAWLAGCVTPS